LNLSTDGGEAETLVVASEGMNTLTCARIAGGEVGKDAAALGFTSISCRTASGGIVVEKELP
jgi:hypothetical protein